jgi:hypothetical protein
MWIHKTAQDVEMIEEWVNDQNVHPDGIRGLMSAPDIHVWVRHGDNARIRYSARSLAWDGDIEREIGNLIETKKIVVLGFYKDANNHTNIRYLEPRANA